MQIIHRAVSAFLFSLGALALTGCEGRHIDMNRRGLNPPPEKAESPEERLYDLVFKRLSPEGADPKTDPAVFRVIAKIHDGDHDSQYWLSFYVDAGGAMRSVEKDQELGTAVCARTSAGGGCEQYRFDFTPAAFSASVPVSVSWSLGDRYRLQGAFDDQTPNLNWGEGRIEDILIAAGSINSQERRLTIAPPVASPPGSAVRLSDPTSLFAGQTFSGGRDLRYDLTLPVPRTDSGAHTVIWLGTDSPFEAFLFFIDLPATASFRGYYRKFGDAQAPDGIVRFALEKVTTGSRK